MDPREYAPDTADSDQHMPSVARAMPEGTPEKLRIAKMAILIKRGLVDGCPCGCRGDYEITDKGIAAISVR